MLLKSLFLAKNAMQMHIMLCDELPNFPECNPALTQCHQTSPGRVEVHTVLILNLKGIFKDLRVRVKV